MTIKLERGKALVIVGPQGSGKSTLARQIAAAYGSFAEANLLKATSPFYLRPLIESGIKTVIVDVGKCPFPADYFKPLIANSSAAFERLGKEPAELPTPNFIFLTGRADCIPVGENDRRFTVFRIEK